MTVQSLKAGVMEIADIFVVNKSDREGAELVEAEILAMQGWEGIAMSGFRRWCGPWRRAGRV